MTDQELDKLMQPIINRQSAINMYVLDKIASRIKQIGRLLPSDVHALSRTIKSGADVREINKVLAKMTELNVRDIRNLIKLIAQGTYLDAKPFYDYKKKPFIPFKENKELQKVFKAIAKQTTDTYVNLSQARAFMLRDEKNPQKLIPTSISKAYYSVVDEAIQASQSGAVDYATAMKRTINQLADVGLYTIQYHPESGREYHQSLEAAVKRNLLDGIRQINQGVQDVTGEQYGADGKEITVHEMSAPDHEPIQGHQFTNEEYEKLQNSEPFKDVNGIEFTAIERAIGTYNCRHFTYSIIVGISKPNFTAKQLEENIKRNHEGYTDAKGRHYTLYQCTQEMRELERKIRKAKRGILVGQQSGNEKVIEENKAKYADYNQQYTAFSKACGLKKKLLNLEVAGWEKFE